LGEEDIYIISFSNTDNSFIYDINLKYGKKFLTIRREIVQTNIEYYEKLEYFLEALKKNDEEDKIDNLFDSISKFSEKKGFSFMIALFLNVYKKKDLCIKLISKFKEMNGNSKDNDKNLARKDYLRDYSSKFIPHHYYKMKNLFKNLLFF
jgi:hypothetical protein